ncbi:MAG TPA: cytochrome b/b6 domain-containing protein [Sulfuricella sp.]|nr:cytochrome b/b6 domain-containing protein [Sulfuricella sp.]
MKYDRLTIVLHILLALSVTVQLVLGTSMDAPRPGVPPGDIPFLLHRFWGLLVLVVLALHWAWQLSGQASNGARVLLPWLFKSSRRDVFANLRQLFRFPPKELKARLHPLAGTVQGLGLLVATLLAVTGLILFFGVAPDGTASATVALVRQIHGAAAPLMWAYLAAHVAFALL